MSIAADRVATRFVDDVCRPGKTGIRLQRIVCEDLPVDDTIYWYHGETVHHSNELSTMLEVLRSSFPSAFAASVIGFEGSAKPCCNNN